MLVLQERIKQKANKGKSSMRPMFLSCTVSSDFTKCEKLTLVDAEFVLGMVYDNVHLLAHTMQEQEKQQPWNIDE